MPISIAPISSAARDRAYPLADGMTQRIAIGVEYNGRNFHGWQRQASPELPTVQGALEPAISQVANHPVQLVCAGRTDAGVHASAQVAHFDVAVDRLNKAWVAGVNSLLVPAVRVVWAAPVNASFHARFSAVARQYQYWIHNAQIAPGIFAGQLTHFPRPLDAALMNQEAQCLLGELNFSSFRAAGCESRTAMRNVHNVRVFRAGQRVCLEIKANAFLLHMVRNIAGSLMAVGSGAKPCGWMQEVLERRDRTHAAATASPAGLYLRRAIYPRTFCLPESESLLFGE